MNFDYKNALATFIFGIGVLCVVSITVALNKFATGSHTFSIAMFNLLIILSIIYGFKGK